MGRGGRRGSPNRRAYRSSRTEDPRRAHPAAGTSITIPIPVPAPYIERPITDNIAERAVDPIDLEFLQEFANIDAIDAVDAAAEETAAPADIVDDVFMGLGNDIVVEDDLIV
jgi:hypothetical protein